MPEPTANEALFDAMVRHQIFLMRTSGAIRNRIHKLLNASEQDIAEKIRDRLRNAEGVRTPADVRRLETLLGIIRNIRTKSWADVNEAWHEELTNLAQQEPELMKNIVLTTAPVVVETILPPVRTLKALVTAKPFEGRVLKDWADSIKREDLRRIDASIRAGMLAGEDSSTIARRVVGSARLKGADGVTEITRRNAAAITRTAVNFIATSARDEFIQENKALFDEEIYVATLDGRTTPICRSLDGKRFEVGTGPQPPLHFNCRSLRVAALAEDAIGSRPAKPVTQQLLLREFANKQGLDDVPRTRAALPRGTRGDFDKFSRARTRQLTGRVPAKTTYGAWLARQSAAFQDDILGKTRGALFRRGGLALDKFVNRAGDEIPLHELARREAAAFRAAGLDPAMF